MSIGIYLIIAAIVLCAAYILYRVAGSVYLKYRGARVVTCPENSQPAGVKVDAKHAASSTLHGTPSLRLATCSRWPEHQNCGQECLKQIEDAPEDCLVRNILTRWYEGKTCVYCGKPIGEIRWADHKPALMSPDRKTVECTDVPAENIPSVLETYAPVCWNCHIVQTFCREHPDMVLDRHRTA